MESSNITNVIDIRFEFLSFQSFSNNRKIAIPIPSLPTFLRGVTRHETVKGSVVTIMRMCQLDRQWKVHWKVFK